MKVTKRKKITKNQAEKKIDSAVDSIVDSVKLIDVSKNNSIEFLSTGSTLLNLTLGGGFPVGKIINLVGDKSSGKTLLAIEFIAYCRSILGEKLKWFYDDAEAGFSFDTKRIYGFDILKEDQNFSNTVEDFAANMHTQLDLIKGDEYLIYTLDSLDSLSSQEEIDRDKERENALNEGKQYTKGTYSMERQKKLSEFFRLRKKEIRNKRCILIIISQVRVNIGVMFGEKYTRTGGKSLDMYASVILWLAEVEKHKKKDRVIGITTKIRCKKNKVGLPFRECFQDILFDYGIDNLSSNIKFLYNMSTPSGRMKTKKQQKIEWKGKEYSLNDFIFMCEENNLESLISDKVVQEWESIEQQISSSERKNRW